MQRGHISTMNSFILHPGRKGFTLVELLIVILIGSLIMGTVVGLLVFFINNFEINREYTAARQKGEMVFAILQKPILQVSLGMPNTSPDFGSCFAENSTLAHWNGPLNISNDRELFIAYAVPSGVAADSEYSFSQNDPFDIFLAGDLSGLVGQIDPSDLDSTEAWVTFPSTGNAFRVNELDLLNGGIKLVSKESSVIPFFDELHFIRALRVSLQNGLLIAEDLTRGEILGQVDGILDISFEMDHDADLLTASVLARGDVRNPRKVTPADLPDWPGNNLSDEMRHYRVSVLQTSWRVRN